MGIEFCLINPLSKIMIQSIQQIWSPQTAAHRAKTDYTDAAEQTGGLIESSCARYLSITLNG